MKVKTVKTEKRGFMYNSYSGLGKTAAEAAAASAEAIRNLSSDYASAKDPEERAVVVDLFLDTRLGLLLTQLSKTIDSSVAALENKIKMIESAKKVDSASGEDLSLLPQLKSIVSTYLTLSGLASQYMLITGVQAKNLYKSKSTKAAFTIIKNLLVAQKTIVPKDLENALEQFGKSVNAASSSEEIDKAFNDLLVATNCPLNKTEWAKNLEDFEKTTPNATDLKIQMLLIALKGFAEKSGAITNKEYSEIAEKDGVKLKSLYETLKNAIIAKKKSSQIPPKAAATSEEGLSTGAIVGIMAGIGLLAGGAWWYSTQSKKGQK